MPRSYAAIWREEGSPLLTWSKALQKEVQRHFKDAVLLGMRYGEPSLTSAVRKATEARVERILLAPLYPQYADATSGSTIARLREVAAKEGFTGKISVLPPFPRAPYFVKPLAEKIRPHLRSESHLLLSFHGLPVKQLNGRHCNLRTKEVNACCVRSIQEQVFCYRAHCLATAQECAKQLDLAPERWTLGFQSRFGRTKWLGPHTEELLRELPGAGKTDLVVAAPSFVADCLETHEELGIQARRAFTQAGGQRFELVECLNGDAEFARGLADAMKKL